MESLCINNGTSFDSLLCVSCHSILFIYLINLSSRLFRAHTRQASLKWRLEMRSYPPLSSWWRCVRRLRNLLIQETSRLLLYASKSGWLCFVHYYWHATGARHLLLVLHLTTGTTVFCSIKICYINQYLAISSNNHIVLRSCAIFCREGETPTRCEHVYPCCKTRTSVFLVKCG